MKDKRQKMTLLLSSETIAILRQFSFDEFGETNVSKAVMLMAKKYAKSNTKSNTRRE